MNTPDEHPRRGAAPVIGGGQLSGVSSAPATELGQAVCTVEPIQITGTAEHMLGLLSRARPRPSMIVDTTVSRVIRLSQLRVEQGPAVAVLKVARDLRGAEELRTQRRVIAEIASHPGLDDDWRELLPRVLAFDERHDATVSVESYRPGIDLADVLARHPDRVEELTAMALGAVAPLHRATARLIVVDNLCSVGQWVGDPVAALTRVCSRLDARLIPKLDRLGSILGRALVGRRMTVCWTHGEYTPQRVRVAGPQGPVNRIVGWDEARGDRLALVDVYLMILTASCQAEGADFGTVVSDRLVAGGLGESERNALRAGRDRAGGEIGDCAGVDERVAILLAWLHHVATVSRKDAGRPQHDVWLAANVIPVLQAVAALRSFDSSSTRTGAQTVQT